MTNRELTDAVRIYKTERAIDELLSKVCDYSPLIRCEMPELIEALLLRLPLPLLVGKYDQVTEASAPNMRVATNLRFYGKGAFIWKAITDFINNSYGYLEDSVVFPELNHLTFVNLPKNYQRRILESHLTYIVLEPYTDEAESYLINFYSRIENLNPLEEIWYLS